MTDVAIKQVGAEFDIGFGLSDIELDDGLETAVIISLYSDARISLSELPKGHNSVRGFWGDALENNVRTGSKLWLVDRATTVVEVRDKLKDYAKESLVWMIEEGMASDVEVSGEIVSSQQINLTVTIIRPDGESYFDFLWSKEGLKYGIS